jgi:hypothetical protein
VIGLRAFLALFLFSNLEHLWGFTVEFSVKLSLALLYRSMACLSFSTRVFQVVDTCWRRPSVSGSKCCQIRAMICFMPLSISLLGISSFSRPSNSPGGGLINLDSYDILRLVSNPESSLGNLRKSNEIEEEEVDCTDDGPDHWRDLDRVITETVRDFVCDGDEPLFLDFSAEEQSEMDSKPLSALMTFGGGVKRKSSEILLTPLITKGVLVHRLRNALFLA